MPNRGEAIDTVRVFSAVSLVDFSWKVGISDKYTMQL